VSLEEAAHAELLRLRKHTDGVTVGALARTEALRQVLGGGDARVAYNTLKHIVLQHDSLTVTAASYSLGFASDGTTHLDRLSDFGRDYDYDQRQARRYSDRGIVELARSIASGWTLEAAPLLEVLVLRLDDEALELYVRTERLHFIEMREPLIETVEESAERRALACDWRLDEDDRTVRGATNVALLYDRSDRAALSIRWQGEIWPRFLVSVPDPVALPLAVQTFGSRMQIASI